MLAISFQTLCKHHSLFFMFSIKPLFFKLALGFFGHVLFFAGRLIFQVFPSLSFLLSFCFLISSIIMLLTDCTLHPFQF